LGKRIYSRDWAISTWVLILHQGLAPTRTIWRGLEQLTGTRVGLGRCNTSTHPHALWLVGAITVLTFLIELTVVRNHGLPRRRSRGVPADYSRGREHLAAHGNRRTIDSVGTALAALKAAAATTAVLRTARTIGRGARNNALSATGGALEDD
jgi:hypothetical protein